MKKLVKVDKNGSKYYEETVKCEKCHGFGQIEYFRYNDNGICYDCMGSGVRVFHSVERTPEYEKKLNERREKLAQKKLEELKLKAADTNKEWLEKMGFDSEGFTFIFLGNTYNIKDELKAEGALFNYVMGWHSSSNNSNRPAIKVHFSQITETDYAGRLGFVSANEAKGIESAANIIKKLVEDKEKETFTQSEYVGVVGERRTFELTLVDTFSYSNEFGYVFVHKFIDDQGNELVWKTSGMFCLSGSSDYFKQGTVTATIKAHKEFRGVKQTELIRCKVRG